MHASDATPLHFLCVSDFVPNEDSGAAGSIAAIGRALAARGHVVDYIWHEPASSRFGHPRLRELFDLPLQQLAQVRNRLMETRYDVVIVSQPYAYLVYEQLASQFPQTLFLNRTHGWEARLDVLETRLGWKADAPVARRPLLRASAWVRARACARTARSAHAVLCASGTCAAFIRRTYGRSADDVPVIPYGIDTAVFRSAARAPAAGTAARLLYVGQYLRRKGSTMLEAVLPGIAMRHPEATLTFVAHAETMLHLERHFRPSFGDRLTLLPWRSQAELVDIYAAHDILVFPSLFEGFGKVFLEAMACGMCVVGYGEGGVSDLCEDGVTARFTQTLTRDALAHLISDAIMSPEHTRRIGMAARDAVQQFTWDLTAARTEAYCRSRLESLHAAASRAS